MIKSYEDWAYKSQAPTPRAPLLEGGQITGVAAVGWHGMIKRALDGMIDKAVEDHNVVDEEKLRQFRTTWEANRITGSINREDVTALQAAASQLGVDPWRMRTFFSSLDTSLRQILASQEQLDPSMADNDQVPKMRSSVTPPMGSFGPSAKEPPGGLPGDTEPGTVGPDGGLPKDDETGLPRQ